VKAKWESLLSRYLQEREALVGMVLIMDARHPLTPLDRQMLDWFTPTGKPVHILLSKADKLSNSEKTLTLRRVEQELAALDRVSVQLFSSLSRLGADDAAALIEGWLARCSRMRSPPNGRPAASHKKAPTKGGIGAEKCLKGIKASRSGRRSGRRYEIV
jgi:GTP-binding protein